jgi:hypothetical protein
MKSLTADVFKQWLECYGKASQVNDAQAASELFARNARYYETSFAEPMTGREAIYRYWSKEALTLKDKESTYQIVSVTDHLGIARCKSKSSTLQSGECVALDCLFLVVFDEYGLCSEFLEMVAS